MQDGKVCEMVGVREYAEGRKVELWRSNGRLVVKAWNEAGYNTTEVDLWDLLEWVSTGPQADLLARGVVVPYAVEKDPGGRNGNGSERD